MAPQMALNTTPQARSTQLLRRRTPFPVVDESSRSALDRFVDFIVGDSPQNRFGMICKECHRHNGNAAISNEIIFFIYKLLFF